MRTPKSVPTLQELRTRVAAGHVNERVTDGYSIFNYSTSCTYDGAWDDVTLQARGLIFDREGRLVARPFPKFFNHGERFAFTPEGPPDSAAVKYDGSLGISYWKDGAVCWSTRGSMESEQAVVAQRIWNENHAHVTPPEGVTLLAEIVGPETRIIVDYPEPALVLLGAIEIETGRDYLPSELEDLADDLEMPFADQLLSPSLAHLLEAAKPLPATAEGWVLRWGDHRVKVKGAEYMSVARLMARANPRRIADAWYAERMDLFALVPEEFRAEMDEEINALDDLAVTLKAEASRYIQQYSTSELREVASAIKSERTFGLVMARLRGKPADYRALAYRVRHNGRPRPADA